MKVTLCDRCHEKVFDCQLDLSVDGCSRDFCAACEREFREWLSNKNTHVVAKVYGKEPV